MSMAKLQTVLFSLGIAVVLALFLNVGFSLVQERPEYPNMPCQPVPIDKADTTGGCGESWQIAQDTYQEEMNQYNFKFFVFSLITGVALLVAGLVVSNTAISWGMMFGGIFQLVFGAAMYWEQLNKYWKFGLLGAALVFLIMVAKKYIDK